jgi:hypothetical protein
MFYWSEMQLNEEKCQAHVATKCKIIEMVTIAWRQWPVSASPAGGIFI